MLLEWGPIAVDSFHHDEAGLLFFLSHAHEDHLKGLHARWSRGKIYCSEVTARLLAILFPTLASHTAILAVDTVHVISFPGQDNLAIEVTLLDANHCPGAVMFLFRGDFGSVLHTGDFRLHPMMGTRIPELLSLPDEQINTLSTYGDLLEVFLDNTFCHPMFDFPSREEVHAEVLDYAAGGWPCLLLVAAGNLGKERLLRGLAQRLQTRVRVPPKRAAFLRVILGDEFEAEFEAQPLTPLEATADDLRALSAQGCVWVICTKNIERMRSRAAAIGSKSRAIFPTGWAPLLENVDDGDRDIRRFPYSDHSSFPELVQFLSWLPAAPVTLLTQLSSNGTKLGYDGEEGAQSLAELANVYSLSYQPAGTENTLQRKRSQQVMQSLQTDSAKSSVRRGQACSDLHLPLEKVAVSDNQLQEMCVESKMRETASCESNLAEQVRCILPSAGATGSGFSATCAMKDGKRRRLPWKETRITGDDTMSWPPKTGFVHVDLRGKTPIFSSL